MSSGATSTRASWTSCVTKRPICSSRVPTRTDPWRPRRGAARHAGRPHRHDDPGAALRRRRHRRRRPARPPRATRSPTAGSRRSSRRTSYSAVAIAGAAGPAIEMARLFQTELEHYEKVEGDGLSLEGKANKLGQMIRMNLLDGDAGPRGGAHLRGLRSPPRRGPDLQLRRHRRAVRGRRTTRATGSGGKDARTTLKKLYRTGRPAPRALRWAAEALDRRGGRGRGDGRPRLHPRDLPDR